MTSIAAAWMNIVYGFAGLRSDRKVLVLNPIMNPAWKSYSFNIQYRSSNLHIVVNEDEVKIVNSGQPQIINIYGSLVEIKDSVIIKR